MKKQPIKNLAWRCMFAMAVMLAFSCDKFLDEKPNKNQVVPAGIRDAQALLDYHPTMNQQDIGAGEASADTYYITPARLASIAENFRRMYTFEKDYLFAPGYNDWTNLYSNIHIANLALETLDKAGDLAGSANVRGQALFFRAHLLFQGALVWCSVYDKADSKVQMGMPLRLNTNFNAPSTRADLEQTFAQVLSDLRLAVQLLEVQQVAPTRPSKAAALGLLARVQLYMGEYGEAYKNALGGLELKGELMDFAGLNASAAFPIRQLNEEVLFESRLATPPPMSNANSFVPASLLALYDADDLRKVVLFRTNADGSIGFKGSYEGSNTYFSGVSTNELYLIAAETSARVGGLEQAGRYLDRLLEKRWRRDASGRSLHVPVTVSNREGLIDRILLERKKELLFRGIRWMDIKRLNRDGAGIQVRRSIGGVEYLLEAGDKRFALPIPEDVIAISGMPQNPR